MAAFKEVFDNLGRARTHVQEAAKELQQKQAKISALEAEVVNIRRLTEERSQACERARVSLHAHTEERSLTLAAAAAATQKVEALVAERKDLQQALAAVSHAEMAAGLKYIDTVLIAGAGMLRHASDAIAHTGSERKAEALAAVGALSVTDPASVARFIALMQTARTAQAGSE